MNTLKLASVIIIAASITTVGHAGDWQKPWNTEKAGSAALCAKTFEHYQLQAVCMENEKDGYEKMQGNFGLPSDVAKKAKARCSRTFGLFQLQAVCMENEKDGYQKMKNY